MAVRAASTSQVRSWGSGTAAVVRLLVAAPGPLSGMAIARAVGVTQPRVSQVLTALTAAGAVRATPGGYVGRRARLMELYARRARSGRAGPGMVWYRTGAVMDQARRITTAPSRPAVAFSADVGPDLLAPWRHPTLAIVYTLEPLDLTPVGFVPAESRGDASVIVRTTSDATLLAPSGRWPPTVDGIPLTDPVQQWADLLELGGEDRHEAADRLRRAILDRAIGPAS